MPTFRFLIAAVFLFCAGPPAAADARNPQSQARQNPAAKAKQRRAVLASAGSWTIQLRYLDVGAAAAAPVDLIVVDHAKHPKFVTEVPFAPDQIAPLKTQPGGKRRIVLCYLSMGEAEDYRYYWKPEWNTPDTRPRWLGKENEQWPGNFLVDYSDPDWQSIIFGSPESYLDRIVAAGFDGVYLDRADAFEDGDGGATPASSDAMISYVNRLAEHARRLNPDFLIVMQNAETLLKSKSLRSALDGIAKEDLYFGIDHKEGANSPEAISESLPYLRSAKRSGLQVFLLEYVREPEAVAKVRKLARRDGFLLHLSERPLDKLQLDGAVGAAPNPAPTP